MAEYILYVGGGGGDRTGGDMGDGTPVVTSVSVEPSSTRSADQSSSTLFFPLLSKMFICETIQSLNSIFLQNYDHLFP